MQLTKYGPWLAFGAFVALAMYFHGGESLFVSHGHYPAGKAVAWLLFLSFLAYSIYCSTQENIFRTVKKIFPLHWARQIGLDLYLGLAIALFVIFLNEGSLFVLAMWLLPVLLFANLATLLYFAMNYDSIVSLFF